MSPSRLTPPQLARLERALLDLRRRLEHEVGQLQTTLRRPQSEVLGELAVYDNHPADIGDSLHERSKDLALEGRLKRRLEHVDRALERLRQGTYGVCGRCGRPIPVERLEAMPEAELCVDCQRRVDESEGRSPSGKRPVEEEVLDDPLARLYGFGGPRRVVWDEEDAWQEVERYGSSDSPQDIPGTRDYNELVRNEDERIGLVEPVEGLVDDRGEPIAGAARELEEEALSDPEGDKAVREGESVHLFRPRRVRRRPPGS